MVSGQPRCGDGERRCDASTGRASPRLFTWLPSAELLLEAALCVRTIFPFMAIHVDQPHILFAAQSDVDQRSLRRRACYVNSFTQAISGLRQIVSQSAETLVLLNAVSLGQAVFLFHADERVEFVKRHELMLGAERRFISANFLIDRCHAASGSEQPGERIKD